MDDLYIWMEQFTSELIASNEKLLEVINEERTFPEKVRDLSELTVSDKVA